MTRLVPGMRGLLRTSTVQQSAPFGAVLPVVYSRPCCGRAPESLGACIALSVLEFAATPRPPNVSIEMSTLIQGQGRFEVSLRLLEQRVVAWAGGAASVERRAVDPDADTRLSASRHCVFFIFSTPRGQAEVIYDDRPIFDGKLYDARRMAVIPAAGEMWTRAQSDLGHSSSLTLFMEPASASHALEAEHLPPLAPSWGEGDPFSWSIASAIRDECETGAPRGSMYVETAALLLQLHLLRQQDVLPARAVRPHRGGLAPAQLRRATDYVKAHLASNIQLADLAAVTGLSIWHFARAFKASTGDAPHRYQMRLRLERAQELLRSTDLSVTAVAAAVGYEDSSQLSRLFRQVLSITPVGYRREHQQ
jgi:AraC-like DNA-binding protein